MVHCGVVPRGRATWGLTPRHSQIYVHESIYETFIAALKKKAEACAIGQAGLSVYPSAPSPVSLVSDLPICAPRETQKVLADSGQAIG